MKPNRPPIVTIKPTKAELSYRTGDKWMRRCMQDKNVRALGQRYKQWRKPQDVMEDVCDSIWRKYYIKLQEDSDSKEVLKMIED